MKSEMFGDNLSKLGDVEECDLREDVQLQKFDDQYRLVLHPCIPTKNKRYGRVEICYDNFNQLAGVIIWRE